MVNIFPKDFYSHLCDDYSLETILEMNDIEPQQVLELLVNEGLLDLADLYFDMEIPDED